MLVTSAGYGTVQHSLRNGVPLLLSGQGQDKPHTGPLAEWSGVGVYIEKNAVSPKEIEETVDKILSTPSYKEKATEMAESYKNYEPIQKIDALIKESLAKLDTL